jgi:hypothetical protein
MEPPLARFKLKPGIIQFSIYVTITYTDVLNKDSLDTKLYLVKCKDCEFEKQVDNATYALNILQLHKNETGHFNNFIKTPGLNSPP